MIKKAFTRPENFYRLLLAIISQDVRIPLSNALYMLKLNNRKKNITNSSEDMCQFLQALEKHLAEAHSLFSELLGWSRTYFIPSSTDSGAVHLMDLTEEIIKNISETQTKRYNILILNSVPRALQLPGSYIEVYRFILRNLILNCSRFNPLTGCDISITADTRGMEYEITVNTNTKLPADIINKVLQSNSRIPSETAKTDWALSLLLCRHCLSELGTELWIENTGGAFHFTLPAA